MTAKRKAALRKAQLASAKKRRGLTKTGRKNFRKAVRKHPVKAAVLLGTAVTVGGTVGWQMGNAVNRRMLSRHARGAQPYTPGMPQRALPAGRGQRALPAPRVKLRSNKPGQASFGRVKDPNSPYYQSRYDRGITVLRRAQRQAPPLRRATVFATSERGITRIGRRTTVAKVQGTVGIGYPRNKRQHKAYLAKKAGYRPNQIQY